MMYMVSILIHLISIVILFDFRAPFRLAEEHPDNPELQPGK